MKIAKKILISVAVLLAGIFIYVGQKPAAYKISRELALNAPVEAVFPFLNSSKLANDWMPWRDSDPQLKMSYSGPETGVGSTSSWESPGRMGVGKAEVVEAIPNQKIKTKITYEKPMQFTQMSEFLLTANGTGSKVRWSVEGENTFIGRLMCFLTVMDMDKYVGGEFEKGLNKLKLLVEAKK